MRAGGSRGGEVVAIVNNFQWSKGFAKLSDAATAMSSRQKPCDLGA